MTTKAALFTYELVRNSRSNHYFWVEQPSGRLTVGDHSGDGWHGEPPSTPAACEDGVLYVDINSIKCYGLQVRIQGRSDIWANIPLLRPNGETSRTSAGWHELMWLAKRLECQVHIVTDAFHLTVAHDQLKAITK